MSIAKAKLYYGTYSLYSAAVRLTIVEKGYGDDEIDWQEVDLASGQNYDPGFLRINPFGTVPTLVAPLEKSLHDVEAKYKALTASRPIIEFLDKSRSVRSRTHTTSDAPAPVLAPATISHLDTANRIINATDAVPMQAYVLSARSEDELLATSKGQNGARIRVRLVGVTRAIQDADEIGIPRKAVPTLEARKALLGPWVAAMDAILIDKPTRTLDQQAAIDQHVANSDAVWNASLPKQLATLETEIVGPYALGDQVSIADMYLGVWTTRLVVLLGGDGTAGAISKIPGVGPKVTAFWEAFIQRPSWQKVYGEKPF